MSEKPPTSVVVGTWNILADGMALGEFMSDGGDSHIRWCGDGDVVNKEKEATNNRNVPRRERVFQTLEEMFGGGTGSGSGDDDGVCSLVVTQENDHFHWLKWRLQLRWLRS